MQESFLEAKAGFLTSENGAQRQGPWQGLLAKACETMPWFWHPTSTCALGSWHCPPASPAPFLEPRDQETTVTINIHVSDTVLGYTHALIYSPEQPYNIIISFL